jgi:multimeric flavodoxin WrbA
MKEEDATKKKILGICGSHKKDKTKSLSWYLLQESLHAVSELGAYVDAVHLPEMNILPCEGCSTCMGGGTCPLLADKTDDTQKLVDKIREATGLIYSFPVYGLHAPGILLNFIGGRAKAFLGEELVVQGKENFGESSLFKGKIVGMLANGGGFGMEMSFLTLWPALFASKAIPVACAGFSSFEYQKVPFIENTPISKRIEDTQWAKNMARSVGQRVYDALDSKARPILEGMLGIRQIASQEQLDEEVDQYGLVWTKSGREEFNKIPPFARDVALQMMVKNIKSLGFTKITREAILEGRKRFASQYISPEQIEKMEKS